MARINVLAEVAKGLKANVYAVDNLSPVSRVAVYIKAGSRYEPNHPPGITHFLKASAGLTTLNSSVFGFTRQMQRAGANFSVNSDREYIVYRVDCMRDKISQVLSLIDDNINFNEFRSWELVDVTQPRLMEELNRLKKDQHFLANEAMHKAAYRGGLAHSVMIPEHQVKKINRDHLIEFVQKNYVTERMFFVGLGIDENELASSVENFKLNNSPYSGVGGASRYVGGEARIQANFPRTLVNYVVQGSSVTDMKSIAVLEVIASLIGSSAKTSVKYGNGCEKSLSYMLNAISPHFSSSIININHTDTGLYGFSIIGPNELLSDTVKKVARHVRSVMSGISENDLAMAKKMTKSRALIMNEDHESVYRQMCLRYAAGIIDRSPMDYVDKLSLKDVQTVVGNLLKSKPTLTAIGNPRYVPYLDEIDS